MTSPSKAASDWGIPLELLKAIIEVESGGDPWAVRFEPEYQWFYDVEKHEPWDRQSTRPFPSLSGVSSATEKNLQATSFGLMQIMGATAREMGFERPFLSELCEPRINLKYGCRYLVQLHRRFGDEHGWGGVAAAYNAGSPRKREDGSWENQAYLDKLEAAGWKT